MLFIARLIEKKDVVQQCLEILVLRLLKFTKEHYGFLAGGIHHNAVGIAIRRFTQRLQSDRTLLEKVSLVQKELELR